MKIKSVLFDLDGTLINSMDYHFIAWKKALAHYKIKIKKDEYFKLEGMALNLIAEKFLNENFINFNSKQIIQIVNNKKKIYKKSASLIKIYWGVKKLLNRLKKNKHKLAIVTSSHFDQVQSSLNANFIDLFDTIVTGDMTSRNKPYPDPFILASKKLKSLPSECLVLENAPLGILAAKKAKMTCIAITKTNHETALLNADFIINKYRDIYKDKKINKILNINEKI